MFNLVLFVAFPYVAVVLAVVVGVYRFMLHRFTYSSLSTEFLEKRKLFWGSVPFHYGIILILLAHLFAIIFSGTWKYLVSDTLRLYTMEVIGLSFAIWALLGLLVLLYRRFSDSRIRSLTTPMDVVLLAFLLWQIGSGIYIAIFNRWGAQWFTTTAVPWIHSLLVLQPKHEYVSSLPLVIRIHMLGGFILLALFPFTRLVHLVSFPLPYLWRPYQVVRWYKRAGQAKREG
ncbi:MAG TPA: respiratory nitrate reductase subunit gamma [Bacilli bacterium]